jgi:hypothetical protein
MSLVRDYDALIDDEVPDRAFDAIFSPEPRPAESPGSVVPSLEERFPVVPCDPTQAEAIARAVAGGSYVIRAARDRQVANDHEPHRRLRRARAGSPRLREARGDRRRLSSAREKRDPQLCCRVHDSQADKKKRSSWT